jgi:hypothetical protein
MTIFINYGYAETKNPVTLPLNEQGKKDLSYYSKMLADLRSQLKSKIPLIKTNLKHAFIEAHETEEAEKPKKKVTKKLDDFDDFDAEESNGFGSTFAEAEKTKAIVKVQPKKKLTYNNPRAISHSMSVARPVLKAVEKQLSSDVLDLKLVKCAILANATPRGLAEFTQQGPENKKMIDDLLRDNQLMKEMLYAGGAKAGRYGKALQIFHNILKASEGAAKGHYRRLALATALELAAPELCGYDNIEPVRRYLFFEKSYKEKELDSNFNNFTIWQYRHVINEPRSESDMVWMRKMLWNYRPDHINAPKGYRRRYIGIMATEFGHKVPEYNEGGSLSVMQQIMDKGGRCGPKAFFGRCLNRGFGIPTWGSRLRSHTAAAYWTPKGWTTILGVSWVAGYWISDKAEPMHSSMFKLNAQIRDLPEEYIKVCRAHWYGDVLGEAKTHGIDPGTGGFWNALALNKMRTIIFDKQPKEEKLPWMRDTYTGDDPNEPGKVKNPTITEADRKITIDSKGTIKIPAVACSSPRTNTDKIIFMKSKIGGMQLHYKRWETPEPFSYKVIVSKAGVYNLSGHVVTVNSDQFFIVNVNGAKKSVKMVMPYTVGNWSESSTVKINLVKGRNILTFNRTVPEDFNKLGYSRCGPEYGGITVKEFTLQPES